MITQMEVFTTRVTTSPLPAATDGNEFTDPIQIRKIDGLGPVNATVNTTPYGSLDGESYSGSSTGKRNIVLTIGLNPNWSDQSPETLRQALYAYFMPKNEVTLRFTSTHMATVAIDGYVESFTPNMFEEDPEYQISIICPKSEFVAVTATVETGVTVALPDGNANEIDYQGSLPAGFILQVDLGGGTEMDAGELRVINDNPGESIFIATADIKADTSFKLSTVTGDKYVRAVDPITGLGGSILGKQAVGSDWLQLDYGVNKFRVAATEAGLPWSLTYFARYGGL